MGIEEKEKDRFAALLAVSLGERQKGGECLTDGEFAALLDGRLDPEKRNKLLAHIDTCDSCFRIWVDSQGAMLTKKSVWRRYAPALSIAVSACLLFLLVQLWQAPGGLRTLLPGGRHALPPGGLHAMLDKGFSIVQEELPARQKLPPLPWDRERTGYGFGPSPADTIKNRAFGAGIWMGRGTLLKGGTPKALPDFLLPAARENELTWPETESASYFELGRWCSLVRAASLSPVILSERFWKDQTRAFEGILEEISGKGQEESDEVVIARLKAIGLQLESAGENFSNRNLRKKIAGEITILIDLLSPRKPAGTGS